MVTLTREKTFTKLSLSFGRWCRKTRATTRAGWSIINNHYHRKKFGEKTYTWAIGHQTYFFQGSTQVFSNETSQELLIVFQAKFSLFPDQRTLSRHLLFCMSSKVKILMKYQHHHQDQHHHQNQHQHHRRRKILLKTWSQN